MGCGIFNRNNWKITMPKTSPAEHLIAETGRVHAHLRPDQIEKLANLPDLPLFALTLWLDTFDIDKSPTCEAAIAARALATWLWATRQHLKGESS
jgi:hypothetical protein